MQNLPQEKYRVTIININSLSMYLLNPSYVNGTTLAGETVVGTERQSSIL